MYIIAVIGQIIFGAYWLYNGYKHFRYLSSYAGYAHSKGIPQSKLATAVSGILLVIGGLGILLGVYIFWTILALIVFIISVTFSMHRFWTVTDPMMKGMEGVNFGKNVALLGALLILWMLPFFPYSLF